VSVETVPSSAPGSSVEALRELYERHKDEVYGFLVRLSGEHALAEALLQEAFIRVHANFARYDPSRPFRPWLFEVVRNTAVSHLRRRKKLAPLGDAEPRKTSDRLVNDLARRELAARASAALLELEEPERALLVQRLALGMKLDELAESLAVNERTVRNRLRSAVEQFTRAWIALPGGRHDL
jgi:RNA polymerase sigma-70 factor (ECF subfamily)